MSRPETKIDWKKVGEYLQAGSNGVEIAAHYGIHPETFYDRCLKDNGIGFTEFCQRKKSHGKARLRLAQFTKAVEKEDSQMLKWLGIHLLGQKDNSENVISDDINAKFVDLMAQFVAIQNQKKSEEKSVV